MPEKPVAKLALDTRAHGEYVCESCEEPLEDAILMSDARIVCPECGQELEAFEQFSNHITSAAPARPGDLSSEAKERHVCDDECRSTGCTLRSARGRASSIDRDERAERDDDTGEEE